MLQLVLSVVVLAATIGTLAHIITRSEEQVRHLPRVLWMVLVIFVPIIGMVLWWTIGREREPIGEALSLGVPGRLAPPPVPERSVETDEDIDALVEREIAFHENEARIRRLEAKLREQRESQ